MGSSRLPGKVLADLAGKPMLSVLLDRVTGLESTTVVVATSTLGIDDPIAAHVQSREDVLCLRGSEDDVLSRFETAIRKVAPAQVVRLTGDNPCVDRALIESALRAFAARPEGCAVVSNHGPDRRDPYGYSAEVVDAAALLELAEQTESGAHREHVTLGLVEDGRASYFSSMTEDFSALRWTVDTADDLAAARLRFAACGHDADARQFAAWDMRNPANSET